MAPLDPVVHRRAAQVLPPAQQPSLLGALLGAAPVVVFELDADGVVVFSQGAPLQHIKGRPASTIGRSVFELYPHAPGVLAGVRRALAGEAFTTTNRVPGTDGHERVFRTTYTPVMGQEGSVLRVVGVATDITQATRAAHALARRTDELHRLTARIQQMREDECTRVAREVHDVIGQELTALGLDLRYVRRRLGTSDQSSAALRLAEMGDRIVQALDATRALATDLRPPELDSLGLVGALRAAAERFEQRTQTRCAVESNVTDKQMRSVPTAMRTALYRIAQEALTNVARHAEAGAVRVSVAFTEQDATRAVTLSITDDGRGFRAALPDAQDVPLGLLGMKERAAEWGGTLSVEASPGAGTRVKTVIPIPLSNDHS